MTSACGVVEHPLRRDDNLTWHNMDITRDLRAQQKGQEPKTIWMTGLSGAGKSTLINEVEKRLFAQGKHTMLLDGDNVRMGLNKNLGFKEQDRIENIGNDNFIEIYISTPLEECERRDVKGLYKRARSGEIPNFSGISSPYEAPENPEITIDTTGMTVEESVDYLMEELKKYL